jgi:hypothetical protein
VNAVGAEAAADMTNVGSPETYVGYERAENLERTQEQRSRGRTFTCSADWRMFFPPAWTPWRKRFSFEATHAGKAG